MRLHIGGDDAADVSCSGSLDFRCEVRALAASRTMRAELIGHFKPCMTEIYLHIDARMADYIRTHP